MTSPAQVYAVVSLPEPDPATRQTAPAVVYVAFESADAAETFARNQGLGRHLVSPLVFDTAPPGTRLAA